MLVPNSSGSCLLCIVAIGARFTALGGEPVMQYVARWRMQLAAEVLRDERATIGELAFARAFKRAIGVSPGSVRRSTA